MENGQKANRVKVLVLVTGSIWGETITQALISLYRLILKLFQTITQALIS